MRQLTYLRKGVVEWRDVPAPTLQAPEGSRASGAHLGALVHHERGRYFLGCRNSLDSRVLLSVQ